MISNNDSEDSDSENNDITRRRLLHVGASACALALANQLLGADEDTPTAEVTFGKQTFGDEADSVRVQRYVTNRGSYLSIHDYSRFRFADGEDPEDYDVPVPEEREDPVCESLIGITEFLEPGKHEAVEVPLYREDSPAVELGAAEEGATLDESQPLVLIPHLNTTDPEEFVCPDDPSTPSDPEDFDGAFGEGTKDTETIPVVHDLEVVTRARDDKEAKKQAERQADLIREGVLVPQTPGFVDEDGDAEAEDEGEGEAEDGDDGHSHDHGNENEGNADAGADAEDENGNGNGHSHEH